MYKQKPNSRKWQRMLACPQCRDAQCICHLRRARARVRALKTGHASTTESRGATLSAWSYLLAILSKQPRSLLLRQVDRHSPKFCSRQVLGLHPISCRIFSGCSFAAVKSCSTYISQMAALPATVRSKRPSAEIEPTLRMSLSKYRSPCYLLGKVTSLITLQRLKS